MASTDTTPGEHSKEQIFVGLIEVTPEEGCEVDPREVAGAFARCYIKAATSGGAASKIAELLHDRRFRVVSVQWCVPFDEVDWEDADNEEARECRSLADESRDLVIGRLDTWGKEEN